MISIPPASTPTFLEANTKQTRRALSTHSYKGSSEIIFEQGTLPPDVSILLLVRRKGVRNMGRELDH